MKKLLRDEKLVEQLVKAIEDEEYREHRKTDSGYDATIEKSHYWSFPLDENDEPIDKETKELMRKLDEWEKQTVGIPNYAGGNYEADSDTDDEGNYYNDMRVYNEHRFGILPYFWCSEFAGKKGINIYVKDMKKCFAEEDEKLSKEFGMSYIQGDDIWKIVDDNGDIVNEGWVDDNFYFNLKEALYKVYKNKDKHRLDRW